MDDKKHSEFIQNINNNPEIFKKILSADKALANMISDMIKHDKENDPQAADALN